MLKPRSALAVLAVVCIALVCLLTSCRAGRGHQQGFRLSVPGTTDRQFAKNIFTGPDDQLVLDGRWRTPDGLMTVLVSGTTGLPVLIHNGPTDRMVVINFQRYPDSRPFQGQIKVIVKRPGAVSGTDTYLFTPTSPP